MYIIVYRKILIISPGLISVQKAFLLGLFLEELVIGRNFAFQNGYDLSIKTAKNIKITAYNSSKQLTVTIHGLIFGRAYYGKVICV